MIFCIIKINSHIYKFKKEDFLIKRRERKKNIYNFTLFFLKICRRISHSDIIKHNLNNKKKEEEVKNQRNIYYNECFCLAK